MTETAEEFQINRYVVLHQLLNAPQQSQIYRFARKLAQDGCLAIGDSQVPNTPCGYGNLVMDGVLASLQPEIERAAGLALFPTYSYFRLYRRGDVLKKHTDRPACEVSVSLCLGYESQQAWPIWIEGPRGETCVQLGIGDALLYRGIECPHWREAFEGEVAAQLFLHYVDQHGPHADWKFDKRSSLTKLPTPSSR